MGLKLGSIAVQYITENGICNKESVQSCYFCSRLIQFLKSYDGCITQLNTINVSQILNDYLHVMHHHDIDEQFELIVNQIESCNVRKCIGFRRHYRDRRVSFKDEHQHMYNLYYYLHQILDTIHCYFMHSHHVGYRLTLKEKKSIFDQANHYDFINNNLLNIKQIISNKCNVFNEVLTNSNHRRVAKSNQLISNQNDVQSFHFGYGFHYGYHGELSHPEEAKLLKHINISQKYTSLKEELVTNNIQVLAIEQFNNEYQKAMLRFNSYYCKRTFPSFIQYKNKYDTSSIVANWIFKHEYILSLMVYCNYDMLQNKFSKLYRSNRTQRYVHNEYYHLGKNLKIAVHKFGTAIQDGKPQTFYHGSNKILHFAPCMSAPFHYDSVVIYCPLSTTISLPVAISFVGSKGMIMEFGKHSQYIQNKNAKYFLVDWLSDYPGEKEYLFFQGCFLEKMTIVNLTEIATGYEYDKILESLKFIQRINILH
eukprot:26657_1